MDIFSPRPIIITNRRLLKTKTQMEYFKDNQTPLHPIPESPKQKIGFIISK
jgi:hypothetical protein